MTAIQKIGSIACAGLAVAAMLYRFPPERYDFYPQCPVFRYLHVLCPGCGATRALAAMVHGRIAEALHYNVLVVLLVPVALAYLASACWKAVSNDIFTWPGVPRVALTALAMTCALFGVLRNFLGGAL